MGFLNFFAKDETVTMVRLPSGSFTVDRSGRTLVSTLPSSFPQELVSEIAGHVLGAFREAQAAEVPFRELIIHYPSLKIIGREMRGGAIVFLVPNTHASPAN